MTEFTGERVVPGQVNDDLWNEHISRYAFAARFAAGRDVLDVGCGAGYGSAELSRTARRVTGVDLAAGAIEYARANYKLPNLQFIQGSATLIPVQTVSADLVIAFEVIEHLRDWPRLLAEASRVLKDDGLFIVSTPNLLYYAQTRATQGPNPFHEHEFEFEEFKAALAETFPHVDVFLQNRAECLAFYPLKTFPPVDTCIEVVEGSPAQANFFVAVCSRRPLTDQRRFIFVPKVANLLRERERHIAKLQHELQLNHDWLAETRTQRDRTLDALRITNDHIEKQSRWAIELEKDWRAAQTRIVELQEQLAADQRASIAKIDELDADIVEKTQWALDTERRLTAEVEFERTRFGQALDLLHKAEAMVEERTQLANNAASTVEALQRRLREIRASRWIHLGRRLGLGPRP